MFTKEIPHALFMVCLCKPLLSNVHYSSIHYTSKIIKFTLKYTSNTENLVKMIFAWHNISKTVNSNNDNEVV